MDGIHMAFDPLMPLPDSLSFMGGSPGAPASSTGLPLGGFDSYYPDWMGEGPAPIPAADHSSSAMSDYTSLSRSQRVDSPPAADSSYPTSSFASDAHGSRTAAQDTLTSSQRLPSLGTLLSGYGGSSSYSNPFQQPAGTYPTPSMAPGHLADAPANGRYPSQNGALPGYGMNHHGTHPERYIAGRRKSPVGAVRPRGAAGMSYLDTSAHTGASSYLRSEPLSQGAPSTPLSAGAAATFSRASSSDHRPASPRTPQADESVPEAALHLLRLALPTGSTGSVATNTTLDEDDAAPTDDAEGESDATSFWSGDDKRHRKANGTTASTAAKVTNRRTSSSSTTSNKRGAVRQHRPARTQREQSTSTRAGSEEYRRQSLSSSVVGRRTSGRVRKSLIPSAKSENGSDSDLSVDDFQASDSDASEDPSDEDAASGKNGKKRKATTAVKGKGKVKASGSKGSPSRTKSAGDSSSGPPTKKAKKATPSAPRRARRVAALVSAPNRVFPNTVDISNRFPRMYRQFPVSSAFPPESYVNRLRPITTLTNSTSSSMSSDLPGISQSHVHFMDLPTGAKWNKASDPFNLYAPRFVKGSAEEKSGLCPICIEPVARGGEGTERWLKLKNSSFVYHLSYSHGLSNVTGLPFSPPTKLRTIQLKPTTKDARTEMTEGLCHKCDKWIPLLSVKNVEAVVPELIWWKHAKPCHGNTSIQGEGDYHIRDAVYDLVVARKSGSGSSTQTPSAASSTY